MASTSGGVSVPIVPRWWKPVQSAQPHSNTATSTPYAALIESRFVNTALSGSTSERSMSTSTRYASTSSAAMTAAARSTISSFRSRWNAESPPTATVATRRSGDRAASARMRGTSLLTAVSPSASMRNGATISIALPTGCKVTLGR